MVGLVAVRVALDVDVALGEELAGDADRLVDVAARVAAQVEDEPVRAGLLDRLEGVDDVVGGAVRERVEGQQRRARARDHRPGDGLHRHVGALEGVLAVLAVDAVAHGDGHLRPGLAADPADDLADLVPGRLLAVDAHDDVAGLEAGLLGGAVLEHRDDQRTAVLGGVDLDADPDVRAGQAGRVGRALGRGHERRVAGVADGLGHALDRPPGERLVVELRAGHVLLVERVPRLADEREFLVRPVRGSGSWRGFPPCRPRSRRRTSPRVPSR